jgi:hypothetical protein
VRLKFDLPGTDGVLETVHETHGVGRLFGKATPPLPIGLQVPDRLSDILEIAEIRDPGIEEVDDPAGETLPLLGLFEGGTLGDA